VPRRLASDGQALLSLPAGGLWYCASHSRYFWGLRLYLLCASDGMAHQLLPGTRHEGEGEVRWRDARSARDEGLPHWAEVTSLTKASQARSSRRSSPRWTQNSFAPIARREAALGKLGGIRQWIESVYNTTKSQLSLEDHAAHPRGRLGPSLSARTGSRRWRLAQLQLWEAGKIDSPGRHFTAYTIEAMQTESGI